MGKTKRIRNEKQNNPQPSVNFVLTLTQRELDAVRMAAFTQCNLFRLNDSARTYGETRTIQQTISVYGGILNKVADAQAAADDTAPF